MVGITSISTAFSSVRADCQAVDNVQDSATSVDNAIAQGSFLPTLAIAMNGLLQQPLAEHSKQAYESCEGLPTTGDDTTEMHDLRPVDIESTLGIEANEVPSLVREGSQAMLAPITRTDDVREHGLLPSAAENVLLQGETITLAGEGLLLQTQTVQSDENMASSQERQSSSTSPAVGKQLTKPDEGEMLLILGERLHAVQPSVELSDVPDTSISLLTREDDGGSPIRGEWPVTAPSSARPSEAPGTRISPLFYNSDGTLQITGERLCTVPSSPPLLDVLDTPATPTMMHKRFGTSLIADEPIHTLWSAARPTDAAASTNLPFVLRPSGDSKSFGVFPTPERGNLRPQEISSGKAPDEPALSRASDRSAITTDGTVSSRNVSPHISQQSVRGIFTPTLATVSSSAILGNGERAFLYQMEKEVTNGVERSNYSESPKEIGTSAPVQTLEARQSGSPPEPQQIIEVSQTAIPLADKSATQVEENLTRNQKHITLVDANPDSPNSGGESEMSPAAGSEANAKNSGSSGSGGTEAGKQPSLQSEENVMSRENTKAGGTTSKGRIEKGPGNLHMSSVEPRSASATPNADSALKTSDSQIVESVLTRGYSLPGVQTSNSPGNVYAKPTGFMSPESGFDAWTISSLVTENLMIGISNEVAQRLRDGVSELKLQLKPESLGEMTLKVCLDDEKVTAEIHVTRSDVKTTLEATMPQLRDALASRGIDVERIDIFAAGDAPARESRGQQETKQKLSARRRGSDGSGERYKGGRSMGYNTIEVVM